MCLVVACGPAVEEPGEESSHDVDSGTTASGDASTSTSSATGSVASAASTTDETAADETAGVPDELPPAAEGDWMCTGYEDPLFVQLSAGPRSSWSGTVCAPGNGAMTPYEWSPCDSLGFGHPNITNTQAYWTFELDWSVLGGPVIPLEMAVDYVPETDTLEGFVIVESDDGASFIPEVCTRYVP